MPLHQHGEDGKEADGQECGEKRCLSIGPRKGSGVHAPLPNQTVSGCGASKETDRGLTDHLADLAAFEALYASHGPRMKSLALNMLGNRSDAEDAVQEAFLRAYRSRHSFRSDAALWTWMYRILLNTCREMGRRRSTRGEAQLDEPQIDRPAQDVDQP